MHLLGLRQHLQSFVEALIAAILAAYIIQFFNSSQTELSSAFVHIRSAGGLLALLSISAISIISYDLFLRFTGRLMPKRKGKKEKRDEKEKSLEVIPEKNADVIQHYKSRSELPPFDQMLSTAEVTVEMSGLDFRIVVHQFMTDIIKLIHAEVCVTFWLLNPESKEVDTQSKIFFGVDDLKESIHKSI
jgi:hypothetical protein